MKHWRRKPNRRQPGRILGGIRTGLAQMSLVEAAAILGVSSQRALQLEQSALRKLSKHPDIIRLAQEVGVPL